MKMMEISGVIVPNEYKWMYDAYDIDATCPNDVTEHLSGKEDIKIYLNSPGGSVIDGNEIYTKLKEYAGNVHIKITSIAASAASVIAMAGDKVSISPVAQIMIHNATTKAHGDYRTMGSGYNRLRKINESAANAYMLRTKLSKEELLKMMDDETFFTANEAIAYGFADYMLYNSEDEVKQQLKLLRKKQPSQSKGISNEQAEAKQKLAELKLNGLKNKTI